VLGPVGVVLGRLEREGVGVGRVGDQDRELGGHPEPEVVELLRVALHDLHAGRAVADRRDDPVLAIRVVHVDEAIEPGEKLLDRRAPEARDLLHRLVARMDALYNNLRGDLPAKLALDYAGLHAANPKIVCCSLTGFGRTGPRLGEPGYDYLLQAYAGFMSVSGEPDAPPTKCGISIVDFSGGILSALALMIGLHRARTT